MCDRIAYKVREAAELIGVSESLMRSLIAKGEIRAVQLEGRWVVPRAELERRLNGDAT